MQETYTIDIHPISTKPRHRNRQLKSILKTQKTHRNKQTNIKGNTGVQPWKGHRQMQLGLTRPG